VGAAPPLTFQAKYSARGDGAGDGAGAAAAFGAVGRRALLCGAGASLLLVLAAGGAVAAARARTRRGEYLWAAGEEELALGLPQRAGDGQGPLGSRNRRLLSYEAPDRRLPTRHDDLAPRLDPGGLLL